MDEVGRSRNLRFYYFNITSVMAGPRDLLRNPEQPYLPIALTNLIYKYFILATSFAN